MDDVAASNRPVAARSRRWLRMSFAAAALLICAYFLRDYYCYVQLKHGAQVIQDALERYFQDKGVYPSSADELINARYVNQWPDNPFNIRSDWRGRLSPMSAKNYLEPGAFSYIPLQGYTPLDYVLPEYLPAGADGYEIFFFGPPRIRNKHAERAQFAIEYPANQYPVYLWYIATSGFKNYPSDSAVISPRGIVLY